MTTALFNAVAEGFEEFCAMSEWRFELDPHGTAHAHAKAAVEFGGLAFAAMLRDVKTEKSVFLTVCAKPEEEARGSVRFHANEQLWQGPSTPLFYLLHRVKELADAAV